MWNWNAELKCPLELGILQREVVSTMLLESTTSFGYFLEYEIAPLFDQEPYIFFSESFVQFRTLTELLLAINKLEQPSDDPNLFYYDAGHCCICMDALENPLDLIRTHCRHCFHPACMLAYLDHNAHRPTCPLCRTQELRLCDRDRSIADTASAIIASANEMELCHRSMLAHVTTRLAVLQRNAAALPTFARLLPTARRASLRSEAAALFSLLAAAARIATAGRGAFLALLAELESRGGDAAAASAAACRRAVLASEFAKDGAGVLEEGAHGRVSTALAALYALDLPPVSLPATPPPGTQLSPPSAASAAAVAAAGCERRQVLRRGGMRRLLACRYPAARIRPVPSVPDAAVGALGS